MAFHEIVQRTVEARGMTIAWLEAGEGPLVVLVHGFPDTADSWRPTLAGLAEAGFRVVAPFTRGIAPTTSPPKGDYASITMAEDILALLDALGEERCMLVGQDWGAMFSYIAANLAPERIAKLVTVAIPHPRSVKPRLGLLRGLRRAGSSSCRGSPSGSCGAGTSAESTSSTGTGPRRPTGPAAWKR